MEASTKQTEAFLQSIRRLSAEECRRIDAETKRIRTERLKALEADAKKRSKAQTEYEVSRIRAQSNRAVSEQGAQMRAALTELRQRLCEQVFARVQANLKAYRASEAYPQRLSASAAALAQALSGNHITLYLSEQDTAFAQTVQAAFGRECTLVLTPDIRFGGLRAVDTDTGTLQDDTLDAALEAQKQWFYENSGLTVEECTNG